MTQKMIFSQANLLNTIREKELFEVYNYNLKNEVDKLWLSKLVDNFYVTKIEKVNNHYLYGMYLLSKEELLSTCKAEESKKVKELILYHLTSPENARSIGHKNIDWRKTKRSKYGKGACFASDPLYAFRHSRFGGAFVVFRVLVKNIEYIPGIRYSLRVPTQNIYDTTLGNMENVYVKYDDFQCYPEYIVYYQQEYI